MYYILSVLLLHADATTLLPRAHQELFLGEFYRGTKLEPQSGNCVAEFPVPRDPEVLTPQTTWILFNPPFLGIC